MADIDRIVVEDANGTTVAQGCPGGVKLEPSPVPYPAQDPSDNAPEASLLSTLDGDATAGVGYLSLGGAALYCDTGKHHILVWEVHKTNTRPGQNDSFSVDLCQTMQGPCLPARLVTDAMITGDQNDYLTVKVNVEP